MRNIKIQANSMSFKQFQPNSMSFNQIQVKFNRNSSLRGLHQCHFSEKVAGVDKMGGKFVNIDKEED